MIETEAAAETDLAIDLHDVAKVYKGKVHALQGIEMRVRRGEVFGLLGPNGAGKSTLVKIIMTVIRPTRAAGSVLGHPVGHKGTLRKVGYLPEAHRFPRYLTGRQTLEFFGAMQNLDRATRKRRSAELLETVGMTAWGDRKVSTYSKGMMQRIGLGQALVADPDLVVLDEPTDGVDPVGRLEIREVLTRLRDQGKTVFINSHILQELELICDRVAILVGGQVVTQGTMDDLTRKSQRYEIELAELDAQALRLLQPRMVEALRGLGAKLTEKAAPPGPPPLRARTAPPLPGSSAASIMAPIAAAPLPIYAGTMSAGQWVEVQGALIQLGTNDPAACQPVIDALRSAGLAIRRIQSVRQNLEALYMEAVIDPVTGLAGAPGAKQGGRR